MSGYTLTANAQRDMRQISEDYWNEAKYRIARQVLTEFAEVFRFLVRSPGAGLQRKDLAEDRLLLFRQLRRYLIVYVPGTDPLQIVAIVGGSRAIPPPVHGRGF